MLTPTARLWPLERKHAGAEKRTLIWGDQLPALTHHDAGDLSGSESLWYDLTYKWNLINKTSKQNITKDFEINNKLTVTRGEGRGGYARERRGRVIKEHV